MNEQINQIIDELISLDASFAGHKDELEKILLAILAVRPEPKIDSQFAQMLKNKLLTQNYMEEQQPQKTGWLSFLNRKFVYASALAAVVVVLIATAAVYYGKISSKGGLSFGSDVRVSHTAEKAFGSLATLTAATGQGGGGTQSAVSSSAPMAFGMGGGGGGTALDAKGMPIRYEPVAYKYVYKGDDLSQPSDKLDVLKKQNPNTSALLSDLSPLGLGLVNINSFGSLKLQSLNLTQDNGYNVYVDATSGTVSINGFYDIMPLNTELCTPSGCPQPDPIKESDIPSDSTLISIANQFLADHGIATTAYGDPEVQNQYRVINYETLKAQPNALVYWPESISVVYPLKVSDSVVYDESGAKTGLYVNISVRSSKVMGVGNLTTQDYQASAYDAETDPARLLKYAENGGLYNYSYDDPNARVVEVDLGTPTQSYVQMWNYDNNTSQQVLVPSLIFPITNQVSDPGFYRQSVVVPLIKDILDKNDNSGAPAKILNGGSGTASPGVMVSPPAAAQ